MDDDEAAQAMEPANPNHPAGLDRAALERIAEEAYQQFKNDTDEDIERKRGVFHNFIIDHHHEDYYEARMRGITRVAHERQRVKMRREGLVELTGWGKLLATFIGGLVVGFGAASLLWKPLAKWLGW
jgi:hypothetical protein